MTMLDDAGGAAATEAAGLPAVLEPRALVPAEVFAPGGVRALLDKIEREVRAVRTDISTPAGRDQVRSLAYKVARSKTALDAMGKGLTDEWRARTDAVNAERRAIRERLDALAEDVRRPLTAWEQAEKDRVAGHERALAAMVEAPGYGQAETSADLSLRLEWLRNQPRRDWQEFAARAADTLAAEIERTERLLVAAQKREAEAAELARLRWILASALNLEHAGDIVSKALLELAEDRLNGEPGCSPEGWSELREIHGIVRQNMAYAFNLLVYADPELARSLVRGKEKVRGLVRRSHESHLERLKANRRESIESSNTHVETSRALKEINALLATLAYPLLTQRGDLSESRLSGANTNIDKIVKSI